MDKGEKRGAPDPHGGARNRNGCQTLSTYLLLKIINNYEKSP